jgi:hypothetical protein
MTATGHACNHDGFGPNFKQEMTLQLFAISPQGASMTGRLHSGGLEMHLHHSEAQCRQQLATIAKMSPTTAGKKEKGGRFSRALFKGNSVKRAPKAPPKHPKTGPKSTRFSPRRPREMRGQ